MRVVSPHERSFIKRIARLSLFQATNLVACLAIPYGLFVAHGLLNSSLIPRRFFIVLPALSKIYRHFIASSHLSWG